MAGIQSCHSNASTSSMFGRCCSMLWLMSLLQQTEWLLECMLTDISCLYMSVYMRELMKNNRTSRSVMVLKGRTRKRKQYKRNMISFPVSILDIVFWISWMLFKWVLQHLFLRVSCILIDLCHLASLTVLGQCSRGTPWITFLFEVYNLNRKKNKQT